MTVQWAGGYTATFPGWDSVQRKAANRIQSVPGASLPTPQPDGPWARFEVRHGDYLGTKTDAERAQLNNFSHTAGAEGQSAWWSWSTFFDPGYSPQVTPFPLWNIYAQFQHQGFVGQAMLNFEVDAAHKALVLAVTNGDPLRPTQKRFVLEPAFKPGKRYDHLLNVGWSSDPTKGFAGVWLNGKAALPLQHLATLYNDRTQALFIQMLYRQAHLETDVVFQAGARRAATYQAAVAAFPAGVWPTVAP